MATRFLQPGFWGKICATAAISAAVAFFLNATGRVVVADYALSQASLAPDASARARWLLRASRWRPDLAEPRRMLAEDVGMDDWNAGEAWATQAAQLDPYDWQNWRALGVLAFQNGDMAGARRDFFTATRYENGAASHFQMANLAFLLGDSGAYWGEMKSALGLAPADQVGSFLQNAEGLATPSQLGRIQDLLPAGRPDSLLAAAHFFVNRGQLGEAVRTWNRLRCSALQPDDRQDCGALAGALANGLLARAGMGPAAAGDAEQAAQVWNSAVAQAVLPQDPARLGQCGDPDFRRAFGGPAFAWRVGGAVPLRREAFSGGAALRIGFDGDQAEDTPIVSQLVRITAGQNYRVAFASRRLGAGQETGLELRVQTGPDVILASAPALLAAEWQTNTLDFRAPPHAAVVTLEFHFQRPSGQSRLSDPVLISGVRVEKLP